MSRMGDTKKKIVEMLERKSETLTDISKKLELAPSTVSQHLQELVNSGTIRLVEDRPRKWKYYELNRNNPMADQRGFDSRRWIVPIGVIALIAILGFGYLISSSRITTGTAAASQGAQQVYLQAGSSVPSGITMFTVSDSPTFYNISALNVTLVNASIHSTTTGDWYNVPLQLKSFNLIALKNISSVLSGTKLQSGSYNEIVLYVSNVSATINGTTRHVILPNNRLVILGDFNVSNSTNSTNWINIDFDLGRSLHITDNGTLCLLPVLNIRNVLDSNLQLNQSFVVVANGPARVKGTVEMGMDQNGSMRKNYSVPQNESIDYQHGALHFGGNGFMPIIIRTNHWIVIGGDARSLINISAGQIANISDDFNGTFNQTTLRTTCLGLSLSTSNQNLSANESALVRFCGCYYPLPGTIAAVSQANGIVNSSVNSSGVVIGRRPPIGCCYPVYAQNGSSRVYIRRCFPYPTPYGPGNITPVANVGGNYNISAANINSGEWGGSWQNGSVKTMFNISIDQQNGNISTNCMVVNGALTCGDVGAVGPIYIVNGLGHSGAANQGRGINPGGPCIGVNGKPCGAESNSSNATVATDVIGKV